MTTRDKVLAAELPHGAQRLYRFAAAVERGEQPAAEDMAALAAAFRDILDGSEPAKALDVAGKQHQGRAKRAGADADRIELMPTIEVERLRLQGMTLEAALEAVSNRLDIRFESLVRYHKRNRPLARFVLESEQGAHLWQAVADRAERKGGKK